MFLENTSAMLSPVLLELAENGKCTLEFDGTEIRQIIFNQYLAERIRATYKEIDQDPELPFPSEESLQITAPPSVTTVNIKTDFVKWLSSKPTETQVLRLSFPEEITSMLITTDLLERKLLDYSVLKVRSYLAAGSNSGYILQRLKEIFTLKDQVLQSMLREIVTRPSQAVENLVNATEFTFSFWAHLVSTILKEFRNKNEKLAQEHAYCQACYLIGLYNVYFKGLIQRDREIELALKSVEKKLLEEPYVFTVSDIYGFRDEKGVPLTKRCPRERLDAFLEKKTNTDSKSLLPEVLRIRTSNKKEFFIHKGIILRLTLNKIFAAAREYKDYYTDAWFENLGDFKKTPVMLRDDVFLQELEEHLKEEDPLLDALLSFELLYLCRKERTVDDEVNRRIDRILDLKKQALIPLDELLGVKRKDIFAEARLKLPLWKTVPLFKHVFRFFDRILGGRRERVQADAQRAQSVKVLSDPSSRPPRPRTVREPIGAAGKGSVGPKATGTSAAEPAGESGDQFGPYAVPDMAELGGSGEGTSLEQEAAPSGAERKEAKREKRREAPASKPSGQTAKQRAAAYKKAVEELAESVIGSGKSIDSRLKELAAKWNPLFAEKAKRNLVEDVNSFVRDQVRMLKRSVLKKPPDLERIENLSFQISENEVFEEIKRKDEFREYIKLYLIKVLGKV